ncbi:hypothetical protein AND4_04615 [Vibrio sp. AND4]|nr:hypothetical protein AND4_04615 [Vibrio sp. AND4]
MPDIWLEKLSRVYQELYVNISQQKFWFGHRTDNLLKPRQE